MNTYRGYTIQITTTDGYYGYKILTDTGRTVGEITGFTSSEWAKQNAIAHVNTLPSLIKRKVYMARYARR